jgi:hypothetical protein
MAASLGFRACAHPDHEPPVSACPAADSDSDRSCDSPGRGALAAPRPDGPARPTARKTPPLARVLPRPKHTTRLLRCESYLPLLPLRVRVVPTRRRPDSDSTRHPTRTPHPAGAREQPLRRPPATGQCSERRSETTTVTVDFVYCAFLLISCRQPRHCGAGGTPGPAGLGKPKLLLYAMTRTRNQPEAGPGLEARAPPGSPGSLSCPAAAAAAAASLLQAELPTLI